MRVHVKSTQDSGHWRCGVKMTPQGGDFPIYEGAPVAGGFSQDELRRMRKDPRLVVTEVVEAEAETDPALDVAEDAEDQAGPVAAEPVEADPASEAAEPAPAPAPVEAENVATESAPVDPEEALKARIDEVIANQLTPADFDKTGKPKLGALRKALPDDTITAELRNAVWAEMEDAGFSAPTE